jgi:alkanesulfonate monooxygenase SsuD/methylene tetrahydromethanopterin reductase-like flavin-dependent oxidoreductase (luciferase family)
MKVHLFAMPTIPATPEERRELAPIGRNSERYMRMLDELEQLVITADAAGIDAFGTTEHHFHTEGGEACPNPILMYTRFAARTEKIKLIPFSVVLPAQDPIRVAEDVALFDNLFPGRGGVAFARGYQHRWMHVLMQMENAVSMRDKAGDILNREIYDEYIEVVLKAWTEDAFDFNGKHYQVPFPHDTGITGWIPTEWTRTYGAPGELDDDGVIRKIGVIPKPVTTPHPEVFVPVTASSASLVRAAQRGFVAFIADSRPDSFAQACRTYQEEAAKVGRDLGLGEGLGGVRQLVIGDTYEEAFELAVETNGEHYHNYFEVFGQAEQMRLPSDPPNEMVRFKSARECTQRMVDTEFLLCGTPDQIKRKLDGQVSCFGDGHLEWFNWLFFMQGSASVERQCEQVERFAKEILPSFQ